MSAQNRAVRSRKTWRYKQPRGPKNLRGPPIARGPWHLPKVPPLNPPLDITSDHLMQYFLNHHRLSNSSNLRRRTLLGFQSLSAFWKGELPLEGFVIPVDECSNVPSHYLDHSGVGQKNKTRDTPYEARQQYWEYLAQSSPWKSLSTNWDDVSLDMTTTLLFVDYESK